MTIVDEVVASFTQALADRNAAVIVGAGMSIPAGLVNWQDLLRPIAADIGLDVEKENDLIAIAQYHLNERGGRHRINQALVNEFSERASTTENHKILARLPITDYWTTNYDHILEDALRGAGKKVDVKITAENLATTIHGRGAVVHKMHGDVSDAANAVLTKDDYESYASSKRGQLFSTALRGDLVSKTFLFLGFSFSDPNLDYILARIRVLLEGNRREHYCLLRRVLRADYRSNEEYQYAKIKQDLRVRDLRRYGIVAVTLDGFSQITEVLKRIESAHNCRQVFVSGSAANFGEMGEIIAQKFMTRLASALTEKGMNVITGFGFGVGPHIINGVLDSLESDASQDLAERLILRPFPYAIRDVAKRRARWTKYREDMISRAGIAIFIFGNKRSPEGELVAAAGMVEEFDIAVKRGVAVIPVGGTGFTAGDLYQKVLANIDDYLPKIRGLKTAYRELGKFRSEKALVDATMRVIDLLASSNASR